VPQKGLEPPTPTLRRQGEGREIWNKINELIACAAGLFQSTQRGPKVRREQVLAVP
jgi:hypothetical protein